MTYDQWLASVPEEFTKDALWRMEVYRLAVFLADLAWQDVTKLLQDKRTLSLAEQLFEAVGSIGANISEGYSRGSGRDQARFHEYALGSARESRGWYWQGRQVLSEPVARHRISVVTRIVRLLLTMIPSERTHKLAEDGPTYDLRPFDPHAEIPFP